MSGDHPDPATRSTSPPAGWYPHPTMAYTRRYWDGAHWTDHIAPMGHQPPQGSSSPLSFSVAGGILLALLVVLVIGWLVYGLTLSG